MRFITLIIIGSLLPQTLFAQQQNANACRQQVHKQVAIEHRLFRSTVYGEPAPEYASIGHVTFSQAGDSWIKTGDSQWESLAEGFEGTTWSNALVEAQTAIPARQGILETRRVTTTDLIPPIVSNVRTFDCRLQTLCSLVQQSALQPSSVTTMTIEVPSCLPQTLERIAECSPTEDSIVQADATDILQYCNTVVNDVLEREKQLLAVSIEYDAAYRNTLQFAGTFDLFINQLTFPLQNTIRQVVNVLGSFQRIPCFLSSCTDYPLESSSSSSFSVPVPVP